MKVASDAWMFFLPLIVAAGGIYLAGNSQKTTIVAAILVALSIFVLFFFRDPEREIPPEETAIHSPADGTVVKIDKEWLDNSTGEKKTRVSIFLTIFNVHINRYPVSGKVIKKELIEGKYLVAMDHMASEENARSVVVIESDYGKVTVKQIVGLIARRIVCNAEVGDAAVKGERYGLIRFGSRMDVIFPSSAEVIVKIGDKVAGGSSLIARFKP